MNTVEIVQCDGCKKDVPKHLTLVGSNGFFSVRCCKACGVHHDEHGCFPGEKCSKCDAEGVSLNVVGHCAICVAAKFL